MTDELEGRRQAEHDRLIAELLDPHEPHTVADQAYASEIRSMQRELDRLRQQLAERGEPEPYAYEYYWPESSKHGRKLAYPNGLPTTGVDDLITVPLYRNDPPAQSAVPEGWKLVPVEPTREMLQRASEIENDCAIHNYGGHPDAEEYWEVMISAAPSAGEAQHYPDDLGITRTPRELSERCAELARRLVRQGDGREAWRPVGSAPHDGTELLLGWWRTWPKVVWCTDVAPYSNLDVAPQGGGFCHGEATHWQPLPEPPAAIAAQRGGDGDE